MLLALARFGGSEVLRDLVSRIAVLGTIIFIVALAGEWLVTRPTFAQEWGSHAELARWEDRYDALAFPLNGAGRGTGNFFRLSVCL